MTDTDNSIKIRIEPLDVTIDCRPDETLIQAAWRQGYYWPTICGGIGECGACRCRILEGENAAGPVDAVESRLFATRPGFAAGDHAVRLACRMTPEGPMTIEKAGVRLK